MLKAREASQTDELMNANRMLKEVKIKTYCLL